MLHNLGSNAAQKLPQCFQNAKAMQLVSESIGVGGRKQCSWLAKAMQLVSESIGVGGRKQCSWLAKAMLLASESNVAGK